MNRFLTLFLLLLTVCGLSAQDMPDDSDTEKDLTVLDMFITENNDTLFLADLPLISVTSSKLYLDMSKYRRMKRHAGIAYPYAMRAVDLLQKIEEETELIEKKRHQRKYLKKLEKQLKDQFKDELTNLTTSQGKILVDMIERETGETFYTTLKGLKNPVTAFFFQKIGKRFGYNLKTPYDPEEDWMLEKIILELETKAHETSEEGC